MNNHKNDLLKIIAIISMTLDHIGWLFFPDIIIFRVAGRLAFPIFAYQIALGYEKTKMSINICYGFLFLALYPKFLILY